MVEPRIIQNGIEAVHPARLLISATVHETRYPGVYHCSRAHDAGLLCHVEGDAGKPPAVGLAAPSPENEHLGVAGGVAGSLAKVMAGTYHSALFHQKGAHRHFAPGECAFRLAQRKLHVIFMALFFFGRHGMPRIIPRVISRSGCQLILDVGQWEYYGQGVYGGMTVSYLFFGRFLQKKGLLSFEDIYKARMLQKRNNLKIGEFARNRGWLTDEDIEKILIIQEESFDKFGDIAVKNHFLMQTQVDELLKHQKDEYLFFGEALVRLGIITAEQLIENLKEFNRLKVTNND